MCDHLIPDLGRVTKFGKWLPSLVTEEDQTVCSVCGGLGVVAPRKEDFVELDVGRHDDLAVVAEQVHARGFRAEWRGGSDEL